MSCEQVEEFLSPYLDNALAPEERRAIATHLESCTDCKETLDDFRRFDTLLAQLPRISPDATLRRRIFASPEYVELTGTSPDIQNQPTLPQKRLQSETRAQMVVLPGGRDQRSMPHKATKVNASRSRRDQVGWGQRLMQVVIAASVLLTLGVGGFIGWNLWQKQATIANNANGITPPAALQQGPIPAGTRFLFLRDGVLWSTPTDGGNDMRRLTPPQTRVAANWTVRPALPGRHAGNQVAYIDLQQSFVHIVRSDGQNDIVIKQALLPSGQATAEFWKTATGTGILSSLVWSPDGKMLAFTAAPKGIPQLYIYVPGSNELRQVALSTPGSVSRPVWSPDSVRIAFEVQANGNVYILDYNAQNRSVLTLSTMASGQPGDTITALNWSANRATPALTWSVGSAGKVHSIWTQRVGIADNAGATLLASGNYLQALYSQNGRNGTGSWLLVSSEAPGALSTLDLAGGIERIVSATQISNAQWSPNGSTIGYFVSLTNGRGAYHAINTLTGVDALIASGVTTDPAPVWSSDGTHLAYSEGTHTHVVAGQNSAAQTLKQPGTAMAFSWSVAVPTQLVVSTGGDQQGIYLVDTQRNTSLQLNKGNIEGSMQWTEIP